MYNVGRAQRSRPEVNGDALAEAMLGMMGEESHE